MSLTNTKYCLNCQKHKPYPKKGWVKRHTRNLCPDCMAIINAANERIKTEIKLYE